MPLSKIVKEEIARADASPSHFLFGGLVQSEDFLLTTHLGGDLTRYRALENDPEVASSLQARKLALVSHEWRVDPVGKGKAEEAIADLVRENLATLNFDQFSLDAEDALLIGYWVGEAMWEQDGKTIHIPEIRTRAQDRFTFCLPKTNRLDPNIGYTDGYEIRLCDRNLIQGETVPARKFLVHTVGSKTHNPFGVGLGNQLYWPVTIKKDAVKSWLIYVDKFASPTPIGKFDPSTGNSAALGQFLSAIATGAWAALPAGYEVDLLEAQRSGSIDAYEGLINRFCNAEISKVILGRLNQGSPQGLSGQPAQNDEAIRQEIIKADADLLCSKLNRTLVRWLTEVNAPDGTKPPIVYRVFEEAEDLKARADRDNVLFSMGFRLSTKAQAEIYGADYVDTSATAGKDEQAPPLVTSLGVGGTQALLGLLQQAAGGAIPRENAIAAIKTIFGVEEDVAAAMVPEAQEGSGEPDLSSLIGGGEEAPAEPTDAAPTTEETPPTDTAAPTGVEAAADLSEAQQKVVEAIALLAQLDAAEYLEDLEPAIASFVEELVTTINYGEQLDFLHQSIGKRVLELAKQRKQEPIAFQQPSDTDNYSDRAIEESGTVVDSMAKPVQQLADAIAARDLSDAAKYKAMQSGLVELYPQMPAAEFGELLAQAIAAAELAGRWEVLQESNSTPDFAEPTKRVLNWNGLKIGITHETGDERHGTKMRSPYGRLYRSYGQAQDGKAIDFYVLDESGELFKIRQLTEDGTLDEIKYAIAPSLTEARDAYLAHVPRSLFGGIEAADPSELSAYAYQEEEEDAIGEWIVSFSEDGAIEFATAGPKKARNCNPAKSLSCGGSCQPLKTKSGRKTICKQGLSPEAQAKVKALKKTIKGLSPEEANKKIDEHFGEKSKKTDNLDTPENRVQVKRLLKGDEDMAGNVLRRIDSLESILPGAQDLFRKAIKEKSIDAEKTGIDSRISTIADYLISDKKIEGAEVYQIGDAIGMASSGGIGKKEKLDNAQKLLTDSLDLLWPKLSDQQKEAIANDSFGVGDVRQAKEEFRSSRTGKDLLKIQDRIREERKKALEDDEGDDLFGDL
ncbi:MAG TPA: DUF935 family protein [Coleofasciculaceae cyanobacterium]